MNPLGNELLVRIMFYMYKTHRITKETNYIKTIKLKILVKLNLRTVIYVLFMNALTTVILKK